MVEPLEPSKALKMCRATPGKPASTMKEEYLAPLVCYKTEPKDTAIRREKYRKQAIAELTIKLEKELNDTTVKGDNYCTTYDDLFQIPGFELKEYIGVPTNTENHVKYPLYKSAPLTVWTERVNAGTREAARLKGMTFIKDPLEPFKRNSSFSKPIYERLDEI